jgi:hypothetical protein
MYSMRAGNTSATGRNGQSILVAGVSKIARADNLPFEEALKKLEGIVEAVESGALSGNRRPGCELTESSSKWIRREACLASRRSCPEKVWPELSLGHCVNYSRVLDQCPIEVRIIFLHRPRGH